MIWMADPDRRPVPGRRSSLRRAPLGEADWSDRGRCGAEIGIDHL